MAAETHPSSSSSSDKYDYDVFLSFRGDDTRGTFTDHLYNKMIEAGIRTFRDKEELKHGEEIGPSLLKSIEQSRISIPIFSKDYASSKWCLQELTKIMECKNTRGQIVWPIFYEVEPSHVRNQTGCFEEAFLKHEKEQTGCFVFFLAIIGCFKNVFLKHKREQGEEKVMTWRKSLNDAGKLKGWNSKDPEYRYETNLINSVVERALSELIKTNLQVAEHPVGIDSHVKEVKRMLDFESQGVQFVGIQGMGGLGKTTIAMAVFNNISYQFESWSFLTDVRERASQCRGLVNLQNKLASNLLKGRNLDIDIVNMGINVIKKQFCNKKVLIVLDDVDHDEQLRALVGGRDWFGSGSRIIITTRDEHILHVGQVDESKIYKPNELDKNLSLQLFSKHAFRGDQPPQKFRELSKNVVSIVGGLPLALKVVGSFLYDKTEYTDWEETLKMLKEFPHEDVKKQLKISYDGLNPPVLKKLFLDIACFFIGMDKESVIPAWEACSYFPKIGIKVLVLKSLVKIDNANRFRMHDQLRDMGRDIVFQENPDNPGERSRLWSHDKALDVLKKYKGTGKVEGLFLDFSYEAENYRFEGIVKLPQIDPADLLTKAFKKMSDLRLLQVDHADHDGNNFGHLPQGIKWLSLKGISSKCVPTISHMEKLAVLDLSRSKITDDWNGWQQIQLIRTLKVLDLSRCYLLKRTPRFSCNTSLERLILDYCGDLVAVHESIGHLKKLVFLSLHWCISLRELPDSISKLSSIKSLILSLCRRLEKLPNELGNMESLTELSIDHTRIEEIPDSIGLLEKLERLSARDCSRLKKLPNLSTLKILKELHLEHCSKLAEIEGIDGLTLLQELDLTNCKNLQSLPELPSSLIKLIATDCSSIERLTNLSNLKNLQALRLHGCEKLSEIQGISGLSLLQKLDLTCCITLQSLPELPPSLIRLDIPCCESMERLPNVSTLKNLEGLCLWGCGQLTKIEGIDGLTLLQELDFTNCKNLQSLPELPSSLIKLNARNCSSIERLPNLSNLKNLRELLLCGCMTLSQIQGINDLTLLQQLDLKHCIRLQSLPELPPSLIRLDVSSCISMKRLPNLPTMKSLQELPSGLTKVDARYCGSIETLPNLSNLKSLQELYLCCSNPSEIQDISGLSLLQELDLKDCKMLQYLPGLPPSLIRLDIEGCISMERSPNLSSLRSLKVLHINNCMNLANIQGINDLTLLQELYLQGCSKLQSLSELPSNLITLHLRDCYNLVEIRGLESLESLINFKVCGCPTYIKSVQKTVSQGTLPTTVFKEGEICNKYYLIPDDDNIKGTIFYFVYQFLRDPASPSLIRADDFTIEAKIWKYDSNKTIKCFHEIRIEGLRANTKKDQLFYSCYFQGLTWFGFPLKKRDIFHVTNASFQFSDAQVKMLDLDIEYEAMEDSQQLEKRVIPLITSTTKKGKKNMMPNLEIGNIAYLLG